MARYTLIIAALAVSINLYAQTDVNVLTNQLGDNSFVHHIEGLQYTNIVSIGTEKGIIVIDSEVTPVFASAIRREIEKVHNGIPIKYLINTHDHGDHTYGNQVFNDAIIIGHEKCREIMIQEQDGAKQTKNQLSNALKSLKGRYDQMDKNSDAAQELGKRISYYEAIENGLGDTFELTPPTLAFSDEMSLKMGNTTLNLYFMGYAHSKSDIVIHCPEEGLLLTGDLIYEGSDPYFDSERIPDIPKWIEKMEKILSNPDQIRFIVPGHEGLLEKSILQNTMKVYIEKQLEFEGKESAMITFKKSFETKGLQSSMDILKSLFADTEHYYFLHPEFDSFAYRMMLQDELQDAFELFKLMAEFFPESYIAFDSLGEVCLRMGDKQEAKKHFGRSLELNPENDNAKARLKDL